MKVLVIGASGLLAKPVIRYMDKAGFQLRLFSRSVNQSMFDKDFEMVQGDVFNLDDVNRAMTGCDAVHISLSAADEALAAKIVADTAVQKGIKLLSIISGCTVSEENRWFPMIENKYSAEQTIINSGIPYLIFRPTWFFESLDLMIRDGKAMMIGKQPNPSHWVSADDLARMVVTAFGKPEAKNKIFFVFGPEQYLMKDLLEKYCKIRYPEIKKVSAFPIWMMRMTGLITGNKQLKGVTSLFAYFEKVNELGNPEETNALLGKPVITFQNWIQSKASPSH
jgi:uncharacterized protein YbjT (DUF2867 family)